MYQTHLSKPVTLSRRARRVFYVGIILCAITGAFAICLLTLCQTFPHDPSCVRRIALPIQSEPINIGQE